MTKGAGLLVLAGVGVVLYEVLKPKAATPVYALSVSTPGVTSPTVAPVYSTAAVPNPSQQIAVNNTPATAPNLNLVTQNAADAAAVSAACAVAPFGSFAPQCEGDTWMRDSLGNPQDVRNPADFDASGNYTGLFSSGG